MTTMKKDVYKRQVEEFIEEWKAWFPDEIKWYQLQAVQLKDEGYRAVMLGHKYVIVQDKRREPAGFPNEISEFVQWLIDGVKECIEMLKAYQSTWFGYVYSRIFSLDWNIFNWAVDSLDAPESYPRRNILLVCCNALRLRNLSN